MKRTAERLRPGIHFFQPSASRTSSLAPANPSDESLGYFQPSACADEGERYFLCKAGNRVRHLAPFQGANDKCHSFRWSATTGYSLAALRAAKPVELSK